MQRLATAENLITDRRWGEAVRLLGSVLEAPEDYFFQPDRNEEVFRSLKTEAQRLLGQLPPEGRESYETQFGAQARQLLDAAVDSGDVAGLAEVSRRFFHTQAGYDATELLGTAHMERDRALPAALCFKRLKDTPIAAKRFEPLLSVKLAVCWARAGQWDQAVDTLEQTSKQFPEMTVLVAGRQRKLMDATIAASGAASQPQLSRKPTSDDLRAIAWLTEVGAHPHQIRADAQADQWPLYRGSPSRNAVSRGGTPLLNRRWAVPVINDPHIEKLAEQLRQGYLDQNTATIPSLSPLAVANCVFMRSVAGLVAVDFKTGKRIWTGPADEGASYLLDPANVDTNSVDTSVLASWIDQRLWEDNIYGTLSSDGQSVFCIEDLVDDVPSLTPRVFGPHGRLLNGAQNAQAHNRLAAYSIASEGKLEWELSVPASDDQSPLAGAFFLGPPLPLSGRLYVLAEIKGEIRLLALQTKVDAETRAKTVEVEWSQQLAMVERSVTEDQQRRLAGAVPSFGDGILICPTSAGAVVAVDLTTRSLLWGYRYPRGAEVSGRVRINASRISNDSQDRQRWHDASVTVVDDRVLITPVEVSGGLNVDLHCLNLLDGKMLWKQPRNDGLYVACVHDDSAIVVASDHLYCYAMADGEVKWETPLPEGSIPSGRGFFNGTQYFLPLSSAEVAAIDVRDGSIVSRAKSRAGIVPGNLICHDGAVISQSGAWLESFYQLDELQNFVKRTLTEHPDDADALALKAELALDKSELDEALELLRKSYAKSPDPRTRQLLVESLLEGLRTDFARYRRSAPELEKLIETPAQNLAYLRELAAGQQRASETLAAFETCLKIVDLPATSDEPERVDAVLSVRRDRWVQARLALLRADASDEEIDIIDRAIERRYDTAVALESSEALRTFLGYFGSQPIAEAARASLVERITGVASPLEVEQLLRRLVESNNPERARNAVARLAELLKQNGRLDETGRFVKQLEDWSDIVCLDGKTGQQVLDDLFKDKPNAAKLLEPTWPTGLVKNESLKTQPTGINRVFAIDLRGPRGPFFEHASVELDQQQQTIAGRDGLGRERWRVSLADRNDHNPYQLNFSLSHARAEGHLLIASLGFQMLAIDTLGSGKSGARVLWRKDLTDVLPNMPRQMGNQARIINMPWGMPRFLANDAFGHPVGTTGAVTPEFVCFQRQRNLTAVHPLTGKTLWVRGGVQPGSDIFGDDELLFVTPPGSTEAMVVRAADGQELGRRSVPPLEHRLMILGRKIVAWQMSGGRATLRLRDVWTEQTLWERTFDAGAKVWPAEDQAVGVLQLDGRFAVLNVADGSPLVDARIKAEPALTEIYVFRTPDRWLLITNRPWSNRDGDNVQPVQGSGASNSLIHGHVYGFDRESRELVFTTPIDGRSLTFPQPADLPVLAFAAQVYRQRPGRETAPQVAILCIDKRTGRVAYENRSPIGTVSFVELVGDPAKQEIVVRTNRSAVKLAFTDEAWPPPTEADTEPPSLPMRAGRAIGRGFQQWLDDSALPLKGILDP